MALDLVLGVARHHLAVAGERDRLDGERGFLVDLALHRLGERFAGLDHAAGQAVEPIRGVARAAHDQHLAVAQDGGADREKRTGRVGSCIGHVESGSFGCDALRPEP